MQLEELWSAWGIKLEEITSRIMKTQPSIYLATHAQEEISPPTTEEDTLIGTRVSRERRAGMGKVHSMRHVSVGQLQSHRGGQAQDNQRRMQSEGLMAWHAN